MAHAVTEADLWTNTVVVPDDGDTRNAASVSAAGVGFQVVADRTRWLRNRLLPIAGHQVIIPITYPADPTNWTFTVATMSWGTAIANLDFDINIPVVLGADIVSFTVTIDNQAGSWVALGGVNLGDLNFYSVNRATGVRTLVDTAEDSASGAPAYDAVHDFTLTLAALHTFDPVNEALWISFQKDNAAGFTTELIAMHMTVQAT